MAAFAASSPQELMTGILFLVDGGQPFWFKGVAASLAAERWNSLENFSGINSRVYGTARYLANDPNVARDEFCRVYPPKTFEMSRPIIVELLPESVVIPYSKLGLQFHNRSSMKSTFVKQQIESALEEICKISGIAKAIGSLLFIVHALLPPGPEFDVSYSDPRVPFSIFVSLCQDEHFQNDLRLAEAIIHECMHLQLTLLEGVLPLVAGSGLKYHSPWTGTMRPSQGILHGLYVFRVIDDFLIALLELGFVDEAKRHYVVERRKIIRNDIDTMAGFEESQDLTPFGRRIALSLLRPSVPVRC